MSHIDDMIEQAAYRSTTGYLNRVAEKTGEEFAREILSDAQFRQDMLQRMRAAVQHTVTTLGAPSVAELMAVVTQLQAQIERLQQQNADIQALLKQRNGH